MHEFPGNRVCFANNFLFFLFASGMEQFGFRQAAPSVNSMVNHFDESVKV